LSRDDKNCAQMAIVYCDHFITFDKYYIMSASNVNVNGLHVHINIIYFLSFAKGVFRKGHLCSPTPGLFYQPIYFTAVRYSGRVPILCILFKKCQCRTTFKCHVIVKVVFDSFYTAHLPRGIIVVL